MRSSAEPYVYRPAAWFRALQARSRGAKYELFLLLLEPGPETRVLDVGSGGGTFLEESYAWPEQITAVELDFDKIRELRAARPGVIAIQADGTRLPFADGAFDIVFCNAVLEHVPVAQRSAICRELRRVGRRHFVAVPNRRFPLEPHSKTFFLHWLPPRWFRGCLRPLISLGLVDLSLDYWFELLTKRELAALLPDSKIITACHGAHMIAVH